MIVSLGCLVQIVGRGEPYTNLCTKNHEDVAEEGHPNDFLGGFESPHLSEDISQHICKREGDCAGIKIKQIEKSYDLYNHKV